MTRIDYIARVHEEDGDLWAEVLDLPGCFASGESLDELRAALEEAIALYRSDDDRNEHAAIRSAERPLSIGELRISVAA
jgi:predicted RNase H-like HicB family nuclease